MRVLQGVTDRSALHARNLFLLVLAIAGVIVGLLGMHVLGGGSHAAHDAPTPAGTAHVATEHDPAPAGHCGEVECDELGLVAATCVLALLALALLAPAAHGLAGLKVPKPWAAPPMLQRRPAPVPSLIVLSISRT